MSLRMIISLIVTMSVFSLAVVTFATDFARKGARYQTNAFSCRQAGADIPGHSYSEVMNGLFTASGR
jgi:hypothetical protein